MIGKYERKDGTRLSGKKLRKCLEGLKKPYYQFIAPTFHE